jgi:hypothetical protein
MHCGALANRRQSPTSLAKVSAPRRVTPGRRPGGPRHRRTVAAIPAGQVGLDRLQRGVAGIQHRPVVAVGCGQGRVVEAAGQQPALMATVQAVAPPRHTWPWRNKNLLRRAGPGSGRRPGRRGPGTAPAPPPRPRSDPDGDQLPGTVPAGNRRQSRLSVLTRSPGAVGIRWARSPHSQRSCDATGGQLIAGRAGLIAGSQPAGITQPRHEPANRHLVMSDPTDSRHLPARAKDTHRDGVPVHIQTKAGEITSSSDTGHRPAPSVCGSVHASVDDPPDTRNGAGRSHAD